MRKTCPRLVLGGASVFLRGLLRGEEKETVLLVPGVSIDSLQGAINYIYTGYIDQVLNIYKVDLLNSCVLL